MCTCRPRVENHHKTTWADSGRCRLVFTSVYRLVFKRVQSRASLCLQAQVQAHVCFRTISYTCFITQMHAHPDKRRRLCECNACCAGAQLHSRSGSMAERRARRAVADRPGTGTCVCVCVCVCVYVCLFVCLCVCLFVCAVSSYRVPSWVVPSSASCMLIATPYFQRSCFVWLHPIMPPS